MKQRAGRRGKEIDKREREREGLRESRDRGGWGMGWGDKEEYTGRMGTTDRRGKMVGGGE